MAKDSMTVLGENCKTPNDNNQDILLIEVPFGGADSFFKNSRRLWISEAF